MRQATRAALCAFVTVAATACSRTAEPIVIGAVAMLKDADGSEDNLRGIRIAIDQANDAGGIAGRRVKVRILKDSGRGELAVHVARQFVEDERVLGVVGHEFSSAMIAAAPVYEGRLAAVSSATSPMLSGISSWVFRVAPSDSLLATDEARLAVARGWRRVAVLYVNDAYGRGHADAFVPAFRALGGVIVSRDPITDTTTSFEVFMHAYRTSHPDAVFVICGPQSYRALLHAVAVQHLTSQIVGGDGWTASLADDPEANGVMWPSVFMLGDTSSVSKHFRTEFHQRFSRDPDAVSAMAYDATRALLEAIRRGGTTRAGVRKALGTPGVLTLGATGPLGFSRGDRVGSVGGMVRVRDGAVHDDVRWSEVPRP